MKLISSILLIFLVLSVAYNCKKEPLKVAPTISLTSVTNITAQSASTGGNVTADGGATVTARGICYSSTNQTPTITDGNISSGTGLGSFTSQISGLSSGTTYYINAYATNSIGTSYSSVLSFKTLALAPVIITTEVSNITTNTASSGGNITNDGGSPVTARGICWSTKENPTVADNKTTDGTGIGDFTSNITNLIAGVTYYFRAYASNSIGTTYGNQLTTTTKEEAIQFEVSPFNGTSYVDIKSDAVPFTVKVLSKIPSAGITYSIKLVQYDNSQVVFKLDTTTTNNNVVLQLGKFGIGKSYSISIDASSKANPSNTASKTFPAKRNRVYKNYLRPSYQLSNYDEWIDYTDIYSAYGIVERGNYLLTSEFCQMDYDGDGLEDIFTGLMDSLINISHPQVLYRNMGGHYLKQPIKIPRTYGCKLLVGDFNNDSIPDIFSLSAVDPPRGELQSGYLFGCNLLLNNKSNNFQRVEFSDYKGYWYAGASGDIDNDGDLDIMIFNCAIKLIFWNDGKANFRIERIELPSLCGTQLSELIDMNNDGYLDLVTVEGQGDGIIPVSNDMVIHWGNGIGFSDNNVTNIQPNDHNGSPDIDFVDVDNDQIMEIVFLTTPSTTPWQVHMYKSNDKGKSYSEVTSKYIPENIGQSGERIRFLRVQDIDKNGRMDIFSTDKRSNIRWEQDVDGVFKRR